MHTIVNLVNKYYSDDTKVCIITPYDGQRAAIVAALKTAKLPFENVYNVDSYQGVQLCSSVSPSRSDLGFQNRARGALRDRFGRAHVRARVSQVAEPHERDAHAVPGGDGARHQPRVPQRARGEDPPGEAGETLGDSRCYGVWR